MAARRSRKTDEAAEATIARGEVCPEHFPGGVPADTETVGCEHGTFRIEPDESSDPPQDPPKDPGGEGGGE